MVEIWRFVQGFSGFHSWQDYHRFWRFLVQDFMKNGFWHLQLQMDRSRRLLGARRSYLNPVPTIGLIILRKCVNLLIIFRSGGGFDTKLDPKTPNFSARLRRFLTPNFYYTFVSNLIFRSPAALFLLFFLKQFLFCMTFTRWFIRHGHRLFNLLRVWFTNGTFFRVLDLASHWFTFSFLSVLKKSFEFSRS